MKEEKLNISADVRSDKRFMSSIALMSVSTLICKILGLIFKWPMLKYVGIQGMAYFSASYHIYLLLDTLATAGLPVALSILVSTSRVLGRRANVRRIFRISMTAFVILGALGTVFLYFWSDSIADWIGMPDAAPSVRAIAPTLFFVCVSSAIRGYFQGHELMAPTAYSQLIESFGKLFLGVLLASSSMKLGADPSVTAAAALNGLSAGVGIAVLYLLISLAIFPKTKRYRTFPDFDPEKESIGKICSDLIKIALPITLSASITSITALADTALITKRLIASGMTSELASGTYSSYSNLGLPLYNLAPALIAPLAVTLVPVLTASVVSGDRERESTVFYASFRICIFFALPASAGLSVFSEPILKLIFPGETEAIGLCASLLSVLSVSVVFACLTTVTNAILQTYRKQVIPIVSMAIGAAAKIISEYVLLVTPVGAYAAPLSTFICTVTVVTLNICFIGKYSPFRFRMNVVWRSLGATVVAISGAIGVFFVFGLIGVSERMSVIPAILSAIILYMIFAFRFEALTEEDLNLIPKGDKVIRILRKAKLMK